MKKGLRNPISVYEGPARPAAEASETATAGWLYGFAVTGYALDALPHPDGLGTWAEHDREITFLLDYDTGSEHLPQLTGKLGCCAELAAEAPRASLPLLFCFGSPRREQSARRALAASADAAVLRIATAALDSRQACPVGPAWMPLHGSHSRPVRLIDLDPAMPDPLRPGRNRYQPETPRNARRGDPGGELTAAWAGPHDPYGQ